MTREYEEIDCGWFVALIDPTGDESTMRRLLVTALEDWAKRLGVLDLCVAVGSECGPYVGRHTVEHLVRCYTEYGSRCIATETGVYRIDVMSGFARITRYDAADLAYLINEMHDEMMTCRRQNEVFARIGSVVTVVCAFVAFIFLAYLVESIIPLPGWVSVTVVLAIVLIWFEWRRKSYPWVHRRCGERIRREAMKCLARTPAATRTRL